MRLFIVGKQSARLDSFVVEYIFLRDIYNCTGGFQHFDLAWGSDIATWVKIGADKGIKTISGDYVYWRKSKKNITPNMDNKMVLRKLTADIEFTHWINEFFHKSSVYLIYKVCFFSFSGTLFSSNLKISNTPLIR